MKISLCLCTYNGHNYLSQMLDSIIGQTKLPNEIIVHDDCSTDNTMEILNLYKNNYQNINWKIIVNKKNLGWRENFKNCINDSSGEIIFLADQDDIWVNNKIEVMYNALTKEQNAELLLSEYKYFYENGSIEKKKKTHYRNTSIVKRYDIGKKFIFCMYPGCTYAFKKEVKGLFNKLWDEKSAHDKLLYSICGLRNTIFHIDYCSVLFRRHENNASTDRNNLLSKEERNYLKNEIDYEIDYCNKLFSNNFENNQMTLTKTIKWLKLRKKYFEKPNIFKFCRLFFYSKYYKSFKNYLKDVNALLYKRQK